MTKNWKISRLFLCLNRLDSNPRPLDDEQGDQIGRISPFGLLFKGGNGIWWSCLGIFWFGYSFGYFSTIWAYFFPIFWSPWWWAELKWVFFDSYKLKKSFKLIENKKPLILRLQERNRDGEVNRKKESITMLSITTFSQTTIMAFSMMAFSKMTLDKMSPCFSLLYVTHNRHFNNYQNDTMTLWLRSKWIPLLPMMEHKTRIL